MLIRYIIFFLFISITVCGQTSRKQKVYPIAFYNVENLYYPMSTDKLTDKEFTPAGAKKWTMDKYRKKLSNLSYVMGEMATEYKGAVIIGIAEVGSRKVLEDLLNTKILNEKSRKYSIVHYDSPDRRGLDVALLYDPAEFNVISSKVYPFRMPENLYYQTRDQLLVSGYLGGEKVHVLVCHYPSRYGVKSAEYREYAASVTKHIADSIRKVDPRSKMIIMGDMNDNPDDKSMRLVLKAKKERAETIKNQLYNTVWELYEKGLGSIKYKGKWDFFDQIIISGNLLSDDKSNLRYWKTEIFNKDYLIQQKGKFKGYPLRTYSGNQFINGFSDHLPVLIYLVR